MPSVVHQTTEGRLDKFGKIVENKSPESHIPLDEYDFAKIIETIK